MQQVCVLLANGFEEIEAVAVIDVLRRADIATRLVGVDSLDVQGSHGIQMRAEILLSEAEAEKWALVVLPGGGPGAKRLRDKPEVQTFLREHAAQGAKVAAICAAPIALCKAGLLQGKAVTSYPSVREELVGARYVEKDVVVDGSIITSRGPATAVAFALQLVEELRGQEPRRKVAEGMLANP